MNYTLTNTNVNLSLHRCSRFLEREKDHQHFDNICIFHNEFTFTVLYIIHSISDIYHYIP